MKSKREREGEREREMDPDRENAVPVALSFGLVLARQKGVFSGGKSSKLFKTGNLRHVSAS
jgi:hypothetical protein